MEHPEKGAGASQLVHVGHGSVVGLEGVVRVRAPLENAAVNAAIVSVLPTLDAAAVHVRRQNELGGPSHVHLMNQVSLRVPEEYPASIPDSEEVHWLPGRPDALSEVEDVR